MENVTIISYPDARDNSLLSLSEDRSRYLLPFGGRFRVVDFTIRNSFAAGARTTLIYSNVLDGLEEYVEAYGPFRGTTFPPVKVVARDYSDINTCYNLILESNTKYYIIYNGDIPSIINFNKILKQYRSARVKSMLFKIKMGDRASMAYKVLVTDQKSLLKVVNHAIKEKQSSPNIFEMVINVMLNRGIKTGTASALYWPIKNIPDYYDLHWDIIWDPDIFRLFYEEKIIQSKIEALGVAAIGSHGSVYQSFISDNCSINGTIENSVIYPGVVIAQDAVIKNSIILPHVKIGPGARVNRCIIDEKTITDPEQTGTRFDIEGFCRIGTDNDLIKNSDFPESLFNGITLVSKNCHINNEARIGGGCYIGPGLRDDYFIQKKHVYDGTSVLP